MERKAHRTGRFFVRLLVLSLAGFAAAALHRERRAVIEPELDVPKRRQHEVHDSTAETRVALARRRLSTPRRLAVGLALTVIFFAGAAFTAGAGNEVASLLDTSTTDTTATSAPAPDASAAPVTTDTVAAPAPAPETSTDETSTDAAPSAPAADDDAPATGHGSSAQPAEQPAPAASDSSLGGGSAGDAPAATPSPVTPVPQRASKARPAG